MSTRLTNALARAAGTFLRVALRISLQVWHETIGALFVLFAVAGGASAWRQWQKGSAQWLVGLTICFSLMMAGFAVVSFRSARRVR